MVRNRDMRCLPILRRRERRRLGDRDFFRRPVDLISRPGLDDWSRGCAPKFTIPTLMTSNASIATGLACQRTKIITTLAANAITTPMLARVHASNGYARSMFLCLPFLSPKISHASHVVVRETLLSENFARQMRPKRRHTPARVEEVQRRNSG